MRLSKDERAIGGLAAVQFRSLAHILDIIHESPTKSSLRRTQGSPVRRRLVVLAGFREREPIRGHCSASPTIAWWPPVHRWSFLALRAPEPLQRVVSALHHVISRIYGRPGAIGIDYGGGDMSSEHLYRAGSRLGMDFTTSAWQPLGRLRARCRGPRSDSVHTARRRWGDKRPSEAAHSLPTLLKRLISSHTRWPSATPRVIKTRLGLRSIG